MIGTRAPFAVSGWPLPFLLLAGIVLAFVLGAFFLRSPWQPRAAYFYAVIFAALLTGLAGARGLFAALGEAASDTPSGTTCGRGVFGASAQEPFDTPRPPRTPDFPQPLPTLDFPEPQPIPVQPIPPMPSIPPIRPIPSIPPLPSFPVPNIEVPETVAELLGCAPGSGRDRAPADAARSGSLLVLAAALGLVNVRGARTMLSKEREHE